MAAKTFHVYRSDGAWTVKKEGKPGRTFPTQQQAITAARASMRREGSGQFVVHGRDGRIRQYGTYRMTRIQEPRKKSPNAAQIERAVSKMALERVQASPISLRDKAAKK